MRAVVTRETDGATLELAGGQWASYMLSPETVIAQSPALDFSGYEYSGTDGGYSVASRYQRRPLDLKLTVMEHWSNPKGLFELAAEARHFFDAHHDDLSVIHYTIDFFSDDKVKSAFRLRHGAITVPFGIKTNVNESTASAQVSLIFADPYLYWIGDVGVGITKLKLYPDTAPNSVIWGRQWGTGGFAIWTDNTLKKWEYPQDGGIPGAPVTVFVLSEATVPASLELVGALENPEVKNLTNGSSFAYLGTIASGAMLTVSSSGEVLLDGSPAPSSSFGELTARGGLNTFALECGDNSNGYADIVVRGAL